MLTFGGRLPWAVGLFLVLTVALSLAVAFGSRHGGGSLFDALALCPADVWRGQVWRLVTWPWIEPGPLGLIFAVLVLIWFGKDVAEETGSPRFVRLFGGILLFAAVGTCIVAQIDPPVLDQRYLGGWALSDALLVAWGLWFPHRVVRIYFIIPIRGFWLAWLTVAITVVFAVYSGWDSFLPELFSEGGILAWIYQDILASRWKRMRRSLEEAQRKKRNRSRRARSAAHLRVIESGDDDPDPLPPDVEKRVDDLLGAKRKPDDE
jgi:membrane associated rhomboid family serine protease